MSTTLPDRYRVRMIEAADMVDGRVVVFKRNDSSLVDRAIIFEQVNRVRNHGGVPSGALPKLMIRPFLLPPR